jgi:hypothetical protein
MVCDGEEGYRWHDLPSTPIALIRIAISSSKLSGITSMWRASKCSALHRTTDRRVAGRGTPHGRKLPGKTSYQAITLEAGVTHDTAFEVGQSGQQLSGDAAISLRHFRKISPLTSPRGKRSFHNVYAAGSRNIRPFLTDAAGTR